MLATQKNESATAFQKSDKQINTTKAVAKVAGVSLNKHSYTKSYLNIIHADDKNEPEG